MSKKVFRYADSRMCRTGLMICGACGKSIDSGMYRYRDAGEKYVNHHRACSLDDPKWSEMDAQQAWNDAANKALLQAATTFRDEWKIDDLDELIESLERRT